MRTRNVTRHVVALVVVLVARYAVAGTTTRLSLTQAGMQANGASTSATARAVSADGRLVAFHSSATNLVAGDTNSASDVFVRDRMSGTTVRVSTSAAGAQVTGSSFNPALSTDGRWVAFESFASALVSGDTNGASDVFLRDLTLGTVVRASVGAAGAQANGASVGAAVSADGRVVAFRSAATNLVAGDTNGMADVFVHDRDTATTTRVSVASDGRQASGSSQNPVVSADGRWVAFESTASNLVAGDTNATSDVFVHDRTTGTTVRVSVASDGAQGTGSSTTPALSADGRLVAFRSTAPDLVPDDLNDVADVFLHDLVGGSTTRVSVGPDGLEANAGSATPALSADGSVVAFQSGATNLVAGDTNDLADVFVRDLVTGETVRASVGPGGVEANGFSSAPALSADGGLVVFGSAASNLVADDSNGAAEVFAYGPACGDGVLDLGEECDDGNAVDGDGCNADCTSAACGDGVVEAGLELCDDGNLVDGDGCDGNCTPTGCGNGIVTAGEACDDGNVVDGDGCDGNCTPTGCGNGVVTAGELCDDGNPVDGDGCEASCTPTLCVGGLEMREPSLVIENLSGVPGDERLVFRGSLVVPAGALGGWDALAHGVQVWVGDLGVPGGTLVEMTYWTDPLPPLGAALACAARRDGWRVRGAGRVYIYRRGGRGREASSCRGTPGGGTVVVRLVDKRMRRGEVDFAVALRSTGLGMPVGPLEGTIVLGASAADGLGGRCATHTFTSCGLVPGEALFVCR